jgi:hypothetical protein
MKIPYHKLPLRKGHLGSYGQYTIVRRDGYAGRIASKELSQYVVNAANYFPKAIELLESLEDIISGIEAEADNLGINMSEARWWWQDAHKFLNKLKENE